MAERSYDDRADPRRQFTEAGFTLVEAIDIYKMVYWQDDSFATVSRLLGEPEPNLRAVLVHYKLQLDRWLARHRPPTRAQSMAARMAALTAAERRALSARQQAAMTDTSREARRQGGLRGAAVDKRAAISAGLRTRTCPHCGRTGKGAGMTRFHFDRCRAVPLVAAE